MITYAHGVIHKSCAAASKGELTALANLVAYLRSCQSKANLLALYQDYSGAMSWGRTMSGETRRRR